MAISFSCHSCGKNIKVKDEMAGRAGKCPGCGSSIQVPHDDGVIDAQPYDDYGDDDFGDPNDFVSSGPTVDEKRKPCPACGEMIVKKAAVCRFCGESFDGRARSKSGGRYADEEDMSTGDWVVAILCSGIGCIAGIIWLIQGKKKGAKMLGVSLLMQVIWTVVRLVLQAGLNAQ